MGLHQQRDVLDDHGILGGGCDQLRPATGHQRVHDAVEFELPVSSLNAIAARAGRLRRRRRADAVAEMLHQLRQAMSARGRPPRGDDVTVDDDTAAFRERLETVDFPAPMPPVRPMRGMWLPAWPPRTLCQIFRRPRRRQIFRPPTLSDLSATPKVKTTQK